MLTAKGGFVELKDGAKGGDVGDGAKGHFVELRDGVEGGDVGGGAEGGFVELGDGVGVEMLVAEWRVAERSKARRGFGIESLERVRVSD